MSAPAFKQDQVVCGWCSPGVNPYGFESTDIFYGWCCVPCVYGAAVSMSTDGNTPGLCNGWCFAIMCASCFFSPAIVVPATGYFIRTQKRTVNDWSQSNSCPSIICNEFFNACTCATCRMATYYASNKGMQSSSTAAYKKMVL